MSRRGFLIGGGMAAAGVVAGGAVWRARSRPAGGRSADGSERSTVHAREPSGEGGVVEIAHAREDRFARFHDLELIVPAEREIAICYHEAYYPDAREMEPIGRCRRNGNRTKFDPPPTEPGPAYIVMSSRGRGTPATSAVDVVLERRTPVLAPVGGRVARVKRYRYEGGFDRRIEITPADAPDLRVVMLHVDDIRIRDGDEVVAGATVLGVPRVFGFTQQVDYYIPGRNPHVHIEVKAFEPPDGNGAGADGGGGTD
jgi:hypothetical protein